MRLKFTYTLFLLCVAVTFLNSCQKEKRTQETFIPPEQLSIVIPPELNGILKHAVESLAAESLKLPNGAKIKFSINELNTLDAVQKISRGQVKSSLWITPSIALADYVNTKLINLGAKQISCRKIFSTRLVGVIARSQRRKILPSGTPFTKETLQYLISLTSTGIPRADLSDSGIAASAYLLGEEASALDIGSLFLSFRRFGNEQKLLQLSSRNYFGMPVLSFSTEQLVINYNRQVKNKDEMLEAIYPSETVPELDYSVCLSDADWITPAEKSAAILFQKYLTSQNVQVAAQQMGFRAVQYVSDSIDSFTSALGAETQPDEVAVPLSSTQINKFFSIQDLLSPKTATMYVIDCSGSMQNDPLANAKRLVRAALEIEREGDLKGLISFSSTPQLISAPISNTHTLLPYLAGLEANGGSSIYDSILLGAEVLRKPEFSKVQRHLVLITDGNDQNSKTNLAFFSNAFQRRAGTQGLTLSIFHIENSEADVSDLKQISDLLNGTLHSLSPSITSEEFLKKIAQG